MADPDQFAGCFLGLALGDALGAPYEGGPAERTLWRLIGTTWAGRKRYTDDTQMSLDTAESLLANSGVNQEHLAQAFASNYRWSRGYGAGAARLLKKIQQGARWQEVNRLRFPEGSHGNGAAMRSAIAGLFFHGSDMKIIQAVQKISEITHPNPLAIEGAKLIALATSFALSRLSPGAVLGQMQQYITLDEYGKKMAIAGQWLENGLPADSAAVVRKLGNGIAATDSCVTALYIALYHYDAPFPQMLRFIRQCSGDTDTIGAMAGAIWGAYNGRDSLKAADIKTLESADRIIRLAGNIYRRYSIQ